MVFKFLTLFLCIIQFASAVNSIPLKKSPSGSMDFIFVEKVVDGKTTLKQVNLPYKSQPVYFDFFRKAYNSSEKSVVTNLYEDHDLKKVIGSVVVTKTGAKLSGKFRSIDGKEVPFTPDFFFGKCEKEKYVAYHNVQDVKGKVAQLGEGPWGKQAWINSNLFDRFTSSFIEFTKLPLKFQYNGERVLSMSAYWDAYVFLQTYNDEMKKYYSYKMPVQRLLNNFPNSGLEFSCDDSSSQARYEDEPKFVNLLPQDFNKSGHVSKDVFGCKFIYQNFSDTSYITTNVTIDKPVDELFLTYAYSNTMFYPLKKSDSNYYFSNLRPDSSPLFVWISNDTIKKISIYQSPILERQYHSNVQSSQDIEIKTSSKFLRHKIIFSDFPQDTSVKLYISQYELGQLDPAKPLEIDFSPGKYPITIRKISAFKETSEEHFNLIVTPNKRENTVDLSKLRSFKHFRLSFSEKSGEIYNPPREIVTKRVSKFSYITDRLIDLSSFLVPDMLKTKESGKLAELLKSSGAGSVVAEGTCMSNIKTFFHTISIYPKPVDTSSSLGMLKLRYADNDHDISANFIRQDGHVRPFKPSLYTGKCDMSESILSLHQVNKVNGLWTDLGRGPWGESGWIKVEAKPLFESKLFFDLENFGVGTFKKKSSEYYTFTPDEFYGADPDQLKPKDVSRSRVIDEDGRLIPKISCELGC